MVTARVPLRALDILKTDNAAGSLFPHFRPVEDCYYKGHVNGNVKLHNYVPII